MPKAIYHSDRGEKSALLLVKNKFEFSGTPAYVPRTAVSNHNPGDEIEIPEGYRFEDFVDPETGEIRTTKDDQPLKVLKW